MAGVHFAEINFMGDDIDLPSLHVISNTKACPSHAEIKSAKCNCHLWDFLILISFILPLKLSVQIV